MTIDSLWKLLEKAYEQNPQHNKRKIKFRDGTPDVLIIRMVEELGEISQAHTKNGNDLEEIADLLVLLLNYAQRKGFSQNDVAVRAVRKLNECYGWMGNIDGP